MTIITGLLTGLIAGLILGAVVVKLRNRRLERSGQ